MRMLLICTLFMFLINTASAAEFTLTSTGFSNNKKIPAKNTCDEGNISPELKWANAPGKTKSFALVLYAMDTPVGIMNLWVIYNIPSNVTELPEGINTLPEGTLVGNNVFNEITYRGPCPIDSNIHHYIFTIYALDTMLDIDPSILETDRIIEEIKLHTIAKTELKGIYNH